MWNIFLMCIRRYKVSRPLYILKKEKKNVKQKLEKSSMDGNTSNAVRVVGSTLWITSVSVLMQRTLGIRLGRHGTEWSVLLPFFYLLDCTALHLNIYFPPRKHEQITIFFTKMEEVILKKLGKRKHCYHCQIPSAQDTPMNRRWRRV